MGGTAADSFDLGRLKLSSGEGRKLELEARLDPLQIGGQRYTLDADRVPVRLDVSHTTTGWSLRLRYDAELRGPCMRCLEEADRIVHVDAREVDQPGGGDELSSPYVEGDELDLGGWVRDAVVLDLAGLVVCREDCAGLCAVCGENLNTKPHDHEAEPDPRWAKLSELRLP
jgi:uncharacterized protein